MNIVDLINGGFEFFGAPFILLSVFKLYKQKQVKGISWVHAGFFAVWGWWNLFYYPALGQWVSFAGGIAIVIVNSIWMGQLIYYSRKAKVAKKPSGLGCGVYVFNINGKCRNTNSIWEYWDVRVVKNGWCEKCKPASIRAENGKEVVFEKPAACGITEPYGGSYG